VFSAFLDGLCSSRRLAQQVSGMAEEEPPQSPAAEERAEAPVDDESASRTFFTGIDAEAGKKGKGVKDKNRFRNLEATPAGNKIMEHFGDLTNLANSLDVRMEALLREHEQDFFLAYKTHMYTVQKEIKALRHKAEQEEAKTREDTKIKALEGELDRFMTQALRLDDLCKGYKKEVDKWKAKAEALDEDRRFLEDQIKGAKRQNKILRAAAERARSSAYTALIATKAQSEAGGQQEATATLPRAELPQRPASTGRSAGAAVRRAKEVRAATPDVVSTGGTQPSRAQDAISPAASFGTGTLAAGPAGGRSVLGSEAEQRYIEAIQTLKDSIEREQYTVRMLQATRATAYSHKSEMEEFFLKCVDEARKELIRKKHIMLNRDKSDREKVLEAMLHNEDILVCLYEKLFPHRTGIARSLGAGGGPAEGNVQGMNF